MSNKSNFITMCHSIYDNIHGKEQIEKIFHPIDEKQLDIIINIYNQAFYKRIQLIEKYIESIPDIDNKVKLKNGNELHTSAFYVNALQHYTSGDY